MTPQQLDHCDDIADDFRGNLVKKYELGQLAHGGNLWEKRCLQSAREEAIDLVTYLYCVDRDLASIRLIVAQIKGELMANEHYDKTSLIDLLNCINALAHDH